MQDNLASPLLASSVSLERGPLAWYRDGAVLSSIATLSVTTIGGVVLSLPAAVATIGWIPTLFMLVIFAAVGDISNIFVIRAYDSCRQPYCESASMDLEKLGSLLLGPVWAKLIRASLITLLFGVISSFNIIVVDMVFNIITEFGMGSYWFANREVISLANILLMWPLTVMKNLSQLRHLGVIGFVSLMYVFVVVAGTCLMDPDLPAYAREAPPITISARSVLALPIFACIYCAQFQIIPLYESLPAASRKHMDTISHVSLFAIALPVYTGFGLLPYLALGPKVKSDFLYNAWPGHTSMIVARAMLALVNLLKIPIIALPLREQIADLTAPMWTNRTCPLAPMCNDQDQDSPGGSHPGVSFSGGSFTQRGASFTQRGGGQIPTCASSSSNEDDDDVALTWRGRTVIMAGVNVVVLLVTASASGLGWITDILGSSCGTLIVFVFPSLLYLAIQPKAPNLDTEYNDEHTIVSAIVDEAPYPGEPRGSRDSQNSCELIVMSLGSRLRQTPRQRLTKWVARALVMCGAMVTVAGVTCSVFLPPL